MTGEAQVPANRWGEENPPRRHRGHGDNPEFGDIRGFDLILGALCVSVMKNSLEGRAESDPIMQNKANYQRARIGVTALQVIGYGSLDRLCGHAKQSQFSGLVPSGPIAPPVCSVPVRAYEETPHGVTTNVRAA
ncbi:MAG: hypothetical protein NTZ17_16680 [Phycisphaerae bacterium]|nr:hypothetical protein [Phycisphaerae bacterium]